MRNFKGEAHQKPHIDFGETSAIPEIHVEEGEPKMVQRKEEKEGGIRIIKDDVAIPEIMKEA